MAILSFSCSCGNQNPKDAIEYDGSLGYEAIICKKCGAYSDHSGEQPADEWSLKLAGLVPAKACQAAQKNA